MSIKLNSFFYHIISFYNNNTILNSNHSSIFLDNETSPYISEENDNEGYLYLLFLDLIIFSSLTYQTYNMSQNIEKNNIAKDKSNLFFMKWLVIANALRTLSLIFILIIGNPNGNNGISWMNSILHIVPAFVFVNSYLHLSYMFSDIYNDLTGYQNLLMKPALTIVINGSYAFLALIALITLLAKAYKTFFYISELLMALLYLILGIVVIYYGKITSEAFVNEYKDKNYGMNMANDYNFSTMGFSLGCLFLLKGASGLLEGIGVYSPPNHNVFDFFWFLILEVLPTIIVIYLMRMKGQQNKEETPRNTLNELELSRNSSTYKPPFEKD